MRPGTQATMTDKPDLATVLEHYGAQIPNKYGYISMRCVLHEDTHSSATVNIDKQRYHCFVCQFDGDVYDVVSKKEEIGFRDAVTRAEAIANGNRREVRKHTGSSNGLLPARARNNQGSRRYVPPRYSK
jgi:DNA primase